MFKEAMEALPSIATSPLAFVAYVIIGVGWLVYLIKRNKLATIAGTIESLPENDRLKALELEYRLQPKKGLSAVNYLAYVRQQYFFQAIIASVIALVVLAGLAVYHSLETRRAKTTVESFSNLFESMLYGTTAADDGRYAESLGFFKSTLTQHPTYTGWANLGYAYDEINHTSQARIAYEEASRIDPSNPSPYMHIANTYKDQGDLEKAVEFHEIALMKFKELGIIDREFEANIRGNLGTVLYEIAENESDPVTKEQIALQALDEHLLPAVELLGNTSKTRYMAQLLNNIGLLHKALGDHDASRDYLEKSLAIKHYLNADVSSAISLFNLADLEISAGHLNKADELLAEASPIFHIRQFAIGIGEVHRGRGNIAWLRGETEFAIDQWEQAKVVFQAHNLGLYLDKVDKQLSKVNNGESPL